MASRVPVNVHLDLYRYWDAKRAGRRMPARADIDPAEIRHLLPHLSIVEAMAPGAFRYRLVGTRVVADLGRDVTGQMVGALVRPATFAASLKVHYERVCNERAPLFVASAFRGPGGAVHAISRLLLPLGPDDERANMVLLSRITRHSSGTRVPADWLGTGVGALESGDIVESVAALEALAQAWERRSTF